MPEIKNNIILKFIRRNKSYFAFAFFSGIISSICTVVLSLSLGKFYEIYFNDTGNKSRIMKLIGIDIDNTLTAFFTFYLILLVLKGITEWTFYFFSKVSADRLSLSLRDRLFTTLLFTRPEVFAKKAPGKYLLRFSGDLQAIQNFLSKGVILFLKDIFFVLIGCWFLMKTDYRLALVVFLYIPLLPLINYFFNKGLKTIIITKRNQKSSLLSFVSERFFNMLSLKTFRKEAIEKKRFKKKSAKLYNIAVQYHRWYAFVQSLTSLFLYALPAILLLLVTVQQIQISKAHLMAFILLIFMQLPALKRIGKIQTTWQAGTTSLNKIMQLLAYPAENKIIRKEMAIFHSLDLNPANGTNFNLKQIKKGSINFIDYPSSEILLKKLTGMMEDANKEIMLNSLPLDEYSPAELRSITAVAAKELYLYGNTIYDAAVNGKTEKKEKIFEEILLKLGFNNSDRTNKKLSTLTLQQKKMILIARAVLTDAPLLVLERPFEDLDEATKNKCFIFLQSLLPAKTIIILNSFQENAIDNSLLSSTIKQSVN
jgi:ABC-type multidrug transport system fused ATPase/permease subunit